MSAALPSAKVLVAEPLSETGLAVLSRAGLAVAVKPELSREALLAQIGSYDALVVRSATKVDRELLTAGVKLRVVARAGVGLDNVDVKCATERGILVVNAPSGNVVSAAEQTIGLLFALLRRIPEAQASVKAGEWKRTKFVGTELQGKTVGLVGVGQVGARVAARLKPFQVTLLAFDPYITDEKAAELGVTAVPLDELLQRSDIVSLHTPVTPETQGLMSAERFAKMKKGALLVNCARGALVDEKALLAALESGQVAGAALDVYAKEPPDDFTLIRHPKVVATPHLGASTVEAQDRVAVETVEMLVEALAGSPFVAAVNLPFPAGGDPNSAFPWMRLAERIGAFVGHSLDGPPTAVALSLAGVPEKLAKACVVAAVKGVLEPICAEEVNLVNAPTLAKKRGIAISETLAPPTGAYANLVSVTVTTAKGSRSAAGTLFDDRHGRIVAVDGLPIEATPEGVLLVITNRDVPGVVGRVGTLLGERGVNISDFSLAKGVAGRAAAVVRLDTQGKSLPAGLAEAVSHLAGIETARLVDLS